jgi:hypothetical protein
VQVLEDHQQRAPPRQGFQEPAGRPEGLGGVEGQSLAGVQRRGQPLGHLGRVRLGLEQRLQLVMGTLTRAGLVDQLPQRPEGDALAVRQAAAGQHGRVRGDRLRQFVHQPGLADASLTEHGSDQRGLVLQDPRERLAEPVQLAVAARQRRLEADRQGPSAGSRRQQPEPAGSGGLHLQRPGSQRAGLLADPDLARRR